jgi:hypothetical protein
MEEPWRWVISDWPSYWYRDTPSKSPVMVTRPSEERSISGVETALKVKACTVGKSANQVEIPAAAGPYNEETLIVWGATTGNSGMGTPVGWELEGS